MPKPWLSEVPGPWNEEPNFEAGCWGGFPYILEFTRTGYWVAWVGVDASHPLYGISQENAGLSVYTNMRARRGSPYYQFLWLWPEAQGLIPHPYRKLWWFGVGCHSDGDLIPALLAPGVPYSKEGREQYRRTHVYRDIVFARAQAHGLAEQLKGAKTAPAGGGK